MIHEHTTHERKYSGCCGNDYTIVARMISHCSMMTIRNFETSVSQLSETSKILRIGRGSSENEANPIRQKKHIIRGQNLQKPLGKSNQIRERALYQILSMLNDCDSIPPQRDTKTAQMKIDCGIFTFEIVYLEAEKERGEGKLASGAKH